MPNEVLTRAIDAVASGVDLSEQQAGDVLAGAAPAVELELFLLEPHAATPNAPTAHVRPIAMAFFPYLM